MLIKKSTRTAKIMTMSFFAGGFDQEHGRFQGDGKYTWACGRSFVGSFKAGVPHGYGEMRFPKVSCAPFYRGIRAKRMEELHLNFVSPKFRGNPSENLKLLKGTVMGMLYN